MIQNIPHLGRATYVAVVFLIALTVFAQSDAASALPKTGDGRPN